MGLFLFIAGTAFSQMAPPVMEDFNDGDFPPQGWTQQTFSGSNVWNKGTNPTMIIGSGAAYAMGGGSGEVSSALVSPAISLPAQGDCKLTFSSKFMFPDANSSYEIWISQAETGNADAYTVLKSLQGPEISDAGFQEINVDIPSLYAGKDIHIAFVFNASASSMFSAWAVDEFELIEISDDPVFKAESSVDAGTAYNNIPFPAYGYLTVSNRGGGTLKIESFSSSQSGISIPGLPFEVAPQQSRQLAICLDAYAEELPEGNYSAEFQLHTNDPTQPEVDMELTASIASAVTSTYLDEGFENGTLPEGWSTTATDGSGNASAGFSVGDYGRAEGKALRCELFANRKQASVRTPYVHTGNAPVLSFYYRVTDWTFSGPGQATAAEDFRISARISKDNGLSWDTVYEPASGQHVPSTDYAHVQIPVEETYADGLCLLEIVFTHENGDFFADIDDICFGTPPANDLEAISLAGNAIPSIGQEETYVATIRNKGTETQTDYSVSLRKADGTEIASLPGSPLDHGESADFEFRFTPETEGRLEIHAEIVLENDENKENDKTRTLSLHVQAENIATIGIGTGETTMNIPLNMEYAQSVSQTLYFPMEINANGGTIEGIAYQTKMSDSYRERIQVYIGETEQNDLLSIIDPNSLQLAFEGEVAFSAQDKAQLVIPFDTPYAYQGKNLVLYIYRPQAQARTAQDLFYGESTTTYRSSVSGFLIGEIDPMDPFTFSVIASTNMPNTTLLMDFSQTGSLRGKITDADGRPCRAASVRLEGQALSCLSDSTGAFEFPHLQTGDYQLQVTKFGFDTARIGIRIEKGETDTQDIRLNAILQFPVGGKVTGNNAPDGLADASVVLSGYEDYLCRTDAQGDFRTHIYAGQYDMKVFRGGYQTHHGLLEVNGADTTLQIILKEEPFPVREASAGLNDEGNADISWQAPVPLTGFRYDAGTASSQFGFSSGTERGVMGSVFKSQARLHEMSWYLTGIGGEQETVNVFVFALDSAGHPTQNVLFHQSNVPTSVDEWSRFEFPEPVDAPDGFFLALSRTSGFLSLGTSDPTEAYPFQTQTHFYSGDYQARAFSAVEEPVEGMPDGYAFNFMIRAEGEWLGEVIFTEASQDTSLGSDDAVASAVPCRKTGNEYVLDMPQPLSYRIYRLEEGMDESRYTLLSDGIEGLQYTDETYASLPEGHVYQYAIRAEYQDGNLSPAMLTQTLPKGMEVAFQVYLSTNSGENPAGAVLTLANQDNDPAHVYTDTAQGSEVTFPSVWRGTYVFSIAKDGFEPYSATVDITDTALSCQARLIEAIRPAYGLEVDVQGTDAVLSWNHAPYTFSDNMESHEDFAIESIGEYTLLDMDGKPQYAIYGIYFPNNGYTGSYIVMNPSQTSPASDTRTFQAHSGDKYLACFSTTDNTANNDWLVLPRLSISSDSRLSFFAQNFTQYYDTALFYVAVSKTLDPNDFESISGDGHLQAPGEWTEFSFDLGTYAGQELYIAIVCVSDDASSILMLDDIQVGGTNGNKAQNASGEGKENVSMVPGSGPGSKAPESYTVYLDGEEVASGIVSEEYRFSGLENGTYTAGVQADYISGSSEIVYLDFRINNTETELLDEKALSIYPNPVQDFLYIKSSLGIEEILLMNSLGEIVRTVQGHNKNVDLRGLQPGLYIVHILTENGQRSFKIIKQ